MRHRNLSIASRSIVAVHTAVTAGPGVSAQTRPVAVCGAIGAGRIVPAINDAIRLLKRAAAKPRGGTRLKGDQSVVVASL